MNIASVVATRATCNRKHVGAVIVSNRNILATGYNGSVTGTSHCDDVGHDMMDGHCVRTIHAEMNAILQAAKNGIQINNNSGAIMYITCYPCFRCRQAIRSVGIIGVYYGEVYQGDIDGYDLEEMGVGTCHLSPTKV